VKVWLAVHVTSAVDRGERLNYAPSNLSTQV